MAGPGALESCVTAELAGRFRLPTLLAFAALRPLKWLTLDFVFSKIPNELDDPANPPILQAQSANGGRIRGLFGDSALPHPEQLWG